MDVKEVEECRICREDDSNEVLIKPCVCSGTIGLVHLSCLSQWIAMNREEHCRVCRHPFDVRCVRIGHNYCQYLLAEETHRVSFWLSLFLTTFVIFATNIMIVFLQNGHYRQHTYLYCSFISSISLMIISLFVLSVESWLSVRKAFKEWQIRHFDVVLVKD
ncbi:E3 ubiquitin-protein ligase MARCHF2-like [Oppia nitens]|uniref:E3 ubiquitin-protein ligase MARCHF2-like n=1 Tax=Oppia nitens TaxID=1686743 RepID=UPI0023DC16E9|nr:E3 ubiquitin-protein ligase MARCHF2-like [Oppia nitens]